MLDFVIVGGNIAGLLSARLLAEDNKISLIEKDPLEKPIKKLPMLIAEYFSKDLDKNGIVIDEMEPIFFDEVHLHDSDGKTILEANLPFFSINYGSIRRQITKTLDGLDIRDKCTVSGKYIESTEYIKKIRIENKKQDVLGARYIIDASGFDMFLTKRVMCLEQHTIRRHNIYMVFRALYKDASHNLDKTAIHFFINNTITPGGLSIILALNDEVHIIGFCNKYMSSLSIEKRCNWAKNTLGIFARLTKIKRYEIILGKPLLTATYKNAFLLGASNMSIYPIFFSGIPHNLEQTNFLAKQIYDLTSEEKELDEMMHEYSTKSLPNRILRGLSNDIFRLLLLAIRDYEIEEIADKILETIKLFTMFPQKIDIVAINIIASIFEGSKIAVTIQKLLRLAVELYKAYTIKYESKNEIIKAAREFNKIYEKNIKDLLKRGLDKKP